MSEPDPPAIELDDYTPFEAGLLPLLEWARPLLAPPQRRLSALLRRLRREAKAREFDLVGFQDSVARALDRTALRWSYRCLLLELRIARHQQRLRGATPQERHADFLRWIGSAAGRRQVHARYPLLRADVERQVAQSERFLAEFLQRLAGDRAPLGRLFAGCDLGAAIGFRTGLGDPHDHGRSVVRLRFEHGCAYYKPRSFAADVAYADFLADLARHGIAPAQRSVAVADLGRHGYAAEAVHAPIADRQDAVQYYRRYGGLVAIAQLLAISDLHYENLIASGAYPVAIDLETLFQPRLGARHGGRIRYDVYGASVLFSNLVPRARDAADEHDLSGLAFALHTVTSRVPVDPGTDTLRLDEVETVTAHGQNLPRFNDGTRALPQDHIADIVAGFEQTYLGLLAIKPALLAPDGPLSRFRHARMRLLLRSTHIYGRLLSAMSHPKFMGSSAAREDVLARLRLGERQWPFLAQSHGSEREALLRGDVPRFSMTVDGTDAIDELGRRIGRTHARSGWAEVRRRLREWSPRDLQRQRYVLAQALECMRADAVVAPSSRSRVRETLPPPPSPVEFRSAAAAIGDRLLALAFRDGRGSAYLQVEYDQADRPAIRPMGLGLYEGLCGLALSFAELGRQCRQPRYLRAAEAALQSIRRRLRDEPEALASIGLYTGTAGWIHTQLQLGLSWRRRSLLRDAVASATGLRERIAQDRELDLIGGAAGCLLTLMRLDDACPDPGLAALAQVCAEHLAASATIEGRDAYWLSLGAPEVPFCGYAHGSAGIAAALSVHARRSGQRQFQALAERALRFERRRSRLGADASTQADPASWCHGASGRGMSRLLLARTLPQPPVEAELDACLATVERTGLSGSHCLCHGQLGQLDFMLQLALHRGDRDLLRRCRSYGGRILQQGRQRWRCGVNQPGQEPLGLMIGLSGIAYGLLRLADPRRTPSVLNPGWAQ
ncbi:type 2 lanthipeptide synthetase LanM [Lysobacter sp. Root983]|uniref:type 2 lanthipeptide synthetase LanM n=1 Tax=Lysobacter sp. Root983 TaxID=1736613 RepID=UPI000708BDD4|nr:type 2 lanthipeptide synthetase LanM [Lysobacter sp. Root983]KRD79816.1 hypothetical protein ASE43_02655 [Lysobacter sp. Root983]